MSIKYYLQPDPLSTDISKRKARLASNQTYDMESIISAMLEAGTTVNRPDILAVLSLFLSTVSSKIADGNCVNLPLVRIRPGINGVFNGDSDIFDPARHRIKINFSGGAMMEKAIADVQMQKVSKQPGSPQVLQFNDIFSDTIDNTLTPGGIGQLYGNELKFNPGNPNDGIYLLHADGSETQITTIAHRTMNKLVFSIPASLETGKYRIEVRKQYGKQKSSVRKGQLAKFIVVAN